MSLQFPVPPTLLSHQHSFSAPAHAGILLEATTGGGTSLLTGIGSQIALAAGQTTDYLMVSAEVVAEYERTIAELRRQLIHYRRLIENYFRARDAEDEFARTYTATPLDAGSVRLINSIIQAPVTPSAVYRDFDEEDV